MSQIEMNKNCEAAMNFAWRIRAELLERHHQSVEIYVPGGPSEQFVSRAISKRMLTVEQVLKIDCDILRSKNMVLVHVESEGDELNGGRLVEYTFAMDHDIPCYIVKNVAEAVQHIRQELEGQDAS